MRAPSIAAAIWLQKDMRSPSGVGARRRGGTQVGKAPPSPEMTISGLTRGQVFGEDETARSTSFPALPDVRPAPQAGCFVSGLSISSESQITLRHQAFGTVAAAPSSASAKRPSSVPLDDCWMSIGLRRRVVGEEPVSRFNLTEKLVALGFQVIPPFPAALPIGLPAPRRGRPLPSSLQW